MSERHEAAIRVKVSLYAFFIIDTRCRSSSTKRGNAVVEDDDMQLPKYKYIFSWFMHPFDAWEGGFKTTCASSNQIDVSRCRNNSLTDSRLWISWTKISGVTTIVRLVWIFSSAAGSNVIGNVSLKYPLHYGLPDWAPMHGIRQCNLGVLPRWWQCSV